jgi:hypothetical protein
MLVLLSAGSLSPVTSLAQAGTEGSITGSSMSEISGNSMAIFEIFFGHYDSATR